MADTIPPIALQPDGRVTAGRWLLEPSHKHFRRRLAWWRVRDLATGRILTGWHFTPSMALRTAAEKLPPTD